jgi:hypothetical protein
MCTCDPTPLRQQAGLVPRQPKAKQCPYVISNSSPLRILRFKTWIPRRISPLPSSTRRSKRTLGFLRVP